MLLLLFSFLLLPSSFCLPASRAPLYVAFLDQLPAQGPGPSLYALAESQRGPLFREALRAAVSAGGLSPVIVLDAGPRQSATPDSGPNVPPGALLVRVRLTRWANVGVGTFTDDEVVCRLSADIVRDGRTVARLGPFLGRNAYLLTEMTTGDNRYLVFRDAARQALVEMAHALPR